MLIFKSSVYPLTILISVVWLTDKLLLLLFLFEYWERCDGVYTFKLFYFDEIDYATFSIFREEFSFFFNFYSSFTLVLSSISSYFIIWGLFSEEISRLFLIYTLLWIKFAINIGSLSSVSLETDFCSIFSSNYLIGDKDVTF